MIELKETYVKNRGNVAAIPTYSRRFPAIPCHYHHVKIA